MTDTDALRRALANLADAHAAQDSDLTDANTDAVNLARVDVLAECDAAAGELLDDRECVMDAQTDDDPARWLSDEALRRGGRIGGREALRLVLIAERAGTAPAPELPELAAAEVEARQVEADRAERLALLDPGDGAPARTARGELAAVRVLQDRIGAAQHAEPVTDWTGTPPDREWMIDGWLAVGRVHLLTGKSGRGKSRLALQLAAALASNDPEAWPVPWTPADERHAKDGKSNHPPALPVPFPPGGLPVVIASWEDEAAEVHRRIAAQPVDVATLGDRLHYVDAAEWGPLWAPVGTAHVQTVAELTAAGRRLRRLCERVGARLLIVDPLAAAYGSDENVRGLVRQYMASWDAWGRDRRCAVLMIAHPPKQSANARGDDDWWSGSSDWPAAARGAWALRHEKATEANGAGKNAKPAQPERTWLECVKASYGMAPESVHLTADGVTWRAAWRPTAEAAATAGSGKPKVAGV